jgi:hypothetical protein
MENIIIEPPRLPCTAGGCDGEMKLVDQKEEPFKTAVLGPNVVGPAVKHTYECDICGSEWITT